MSYSIYFDILKERYIFILSVLYSFIFLLDASAIVIIHTSSMSAYKEELSYNCLLNYRQIKGLHAHQKKYSM